MTRPRTPLLTCLLPIAALAILAPDSSSGQHPSEDAEPLLVRGFRNPPAETKPWVYWYWVSDNVSREGITRDLEAMARVGIGRALIGYVHLDAVPRGSLRILTDAWWDLVEHAVREGGRLGVGIGIFNCPGWSQSGGPWVTPDIAMRYLVFGEIRATGPAKLEVRLPVPREPFQDVAVVAFPAPRDDAADLAARAPKVTCSPATEDLPQRMCDGSLATATAFPPLSGRGRERITIDLEVEEPFTARSLLVHPAEPTFAAECELLAGEADGRYRSVRSFSLDRSSPVPNVGPMPDGPVAIAFPAETATRFRLVMTDVRGRCDVAEIRLSGAARIERFVEKQLGKMSHAPIPPWDAYRFPPQPEPERRDLAIDPARIVNLSGRLAADGTLSWDVPPGDWVILRAGMTPTGTRNWPAPPEGEGLEVDKMNRTAVKRHFDAYVGKLLARMPPNERSALHHVVADSYEMGPQNWTDGFAARFAEELGYDPIPWLPVLTGRVVGSAEASDRFLWDLRRLVADRIALDYVGGLKEACGEHGLELWLQNYGHWGFPSEFLLYGGQADCISGEFWASGDLGSVEVRAAASASHVYGKPVVSAEAFTGEPLFASTPWSLKTRGDRAMAAGANHFALHLGIHQPWDDRRPGINATFGTEFNRHNTWFEASRTWIDDFRRSQFLLRQGRPVADVAYFIGEDAPAMSGRAHPEMPDGHDFDFINADAIERRLKVEDGRFVLPDGVSYRLLVLPENDTMRPETLKRIGDLVAAGGALLGSPPGRSPSLKGHPACDERVRSLASVIWAGCDGKETTHARAGGGHVFRGTSIRDALDALGIRPDVSGLPRETVVWTHRSTADADIYFLASQSSQPVAIAPTFRVRGREPEIWHPDSPRISRTAAFAPTPDGVRVPVDLDARGSLFVVFRQRSTEAPRVMAVLKDEEVVVSTEARFVEPERDAAGIHRTGTFTLALWAKPDAETTLPEEAASGTLSGVPRNDAIYPPHGGSLFKDESHACAGLSIGTNGVVVWEHSGGYFAPLLVHPAPIPDWIHVALAYRDARPSLYLNGTLARTGLRSRYTVHPSPPGSEVLGGRPFSGEIGEIAQFGEALPAAEIAELAKTPTPAGGGAQLPPVLVNRRPDGGLEVEVSQAGAYEVRLSDGRSHGLDLRSLPGPIPIEGAWGVSFPPAMDAPATTTFDALLSWPEHPDATIRFFSGTAAYRKSFDLPPDRLRGDRRALLDLGRVESIAEVTLNGRILGTLWKPRYLIDLGSAARAGPNVLEVRVTNSWLNRLIGATRHPEGFPGLGPPRFRPFLAADVWSRLGDRLAPAGLIGPVRIRTVERVPLP